MRPVESIGPLQRSSVTETFRPQWLHVAADDREWPSEALQMAGQHPEVLQDAHRRYKTFSEKMPFCRKDWLFLRKSKSWGKLFLYASLDAFAILPMITNSSQFDLSSSLATLESNLISQRSQCFEILAFGNTLSLSLIFFSLNYCNVLIDASAHIFFFLFVNTYAGALLLSIFASKL